MAIGKKLRHILIDKNVQQKELATAAGTSEAYISYILDDIKPPSLAVLKKISDYLEISIDMLLADENNIR